MNTAIKKLPQSFKKWWIGSLKRVLSDEEVAIKRWYIALYIPLAILLCSLSLFSDALKIFIAAPTFVLIPYFWGEAINYWCFPLITPKLNIPLKIFIRWILGTLLLLSIVYLLNITQKYHFSWFYWGSVGLSTFFGLLFSCIKPTIHVRRSQITTAIIVTILAIVPFIIIKYFNQFPLQRAGDNTFLARWAENIIQGELSVPLYGIGNYLPILPILLALVCNVANILPIESIWGLTVLTYITLSFGVYLLSYELARRRALALLTAGLVVWYRNSDMVVDLINYRSKILLLVIFVWSLYWFIKVWRKTSVRERKINMLGLIIVPAIVAYLMLTSTAYHLQYSLIIIFAIVHAFFLRKQAAQSLFLYLLIGLFWVVNHNFSGTVTLMLVSLLLFYWRLTNNEFNFKDKATSLLVTSAGIFFIAYKMITGRAGISSDGGILKFLRLLFIPDNRLLYDYSLYEKLGLLALTFSYAIPILCVIGFAIALVKKRKDGGFTAIIIISVALLFGYALALPHIYRLADFMVYPITFFACFALYELWCFTKRFRGGRVLGILLASASTFYFVYFIAMPYITNAKNHWFTTFTIHEYEAVKWLRNAYGSNIIILTSPELAKVAAGTVGATWQYDIGSRIPRESERVYGLYYYYLVIDHDKSLATAPTISVNGVNRITNVIDNRQSLYFMSIANYQGDFRNTVEVTNASDIINIEIYAISNQTDKQLLKSWGKDELRSNIVDNQNMLKIDFENFAEAVYDKASTSYRTLSARSLLIYRLLTEKNDKEAELTMRILKNYYKTEQKPKTQGLGFFVMVSDATTDWVAKKGTANESLLYRSGVFSRFDGFKKFFNNEYYDVVYSDKRGGVYIFAPKF